MTQAELYLRTDEFPLWNGYKRPKVLRRDEFGRLIFGDGSWVEYTASGEANTGMYSPTEWRAAEVDAWNKGRSDRLGFQKMSADFVGDTRRHPARVCEQYRGGFFSVENWPRRSRVEQKFS